MTEQGQFPATRLRRARMQPWLRELVAETRLHPSDLIWPVFVQEGENTETPVASMPGVSRLTLDILAQKTKEAYALGIRAMAIFPIVDDTLKSPLGDEAMHPKNLACRAIAAIKNAAPEMGVIADVALDPYTTHGQDGIVEDGIVVNDRTLEILCKQAVVLAEAGADMVAPSDMMDGRIGAIRAALEHKKLHDTVILSYAAKYASSFYGPFRDAVGSAKNLGSADKKNYQMDPANSDEAMREIALDIAEGADMVMVKPGIAYLDIIARAKARFDVPMFAYQVSGEYAMIKAAAQNGWVDGDAVMMESLLAFKRAGARGILTYAAVEVAKKI
ncbi:MAG: porphobilinogen synthase [Alphaproteobacteria bacterium]|nr:porphobilinogen synthase [Alphaproteobacteria bacterium]